MAAGKVQVLLVVGGFEWKPDFENLGEWTKNALLFSQVIKTESMVDDADSVLPSEVVEVSLIFIWQQLIFL